MINYEAMPNCELVRTLVGFPRMPKNKGLAILMNNKDQHYLTSIINTKRFRYSEYIKSFYINYRYRLKFFNKQVNELIDTKEVQQLILKQPGSNIKKAYKLISQYDGNNTYVAMHKYNEYFFERAGNYKGDMVISEYLKLIQEVSAPLDKYTKKIMLIDLLEWQDDIKSPSLFNYINAKTPLTILYNLMNRFLDKFKTLDCEFLIVYGRYKIKVVPSECDETSADLLKTNIRKMSITRTSPFDEAEEDLSDKESIKVVIEDKKGNVADQLRTSIITDKVYEELRPSYFTGKLEDNGVVDATLNTVKEIEKSIDEKVTKAIDNNDNITEKELLDKAKNEINEDKELLAKIQTVTSNIATSNLSNADTKRNRLLKENQAKLKINNSGKTIDDIIKDSKENILEFEEIKIDTPNKDMKQMRFPAFAKEYNKKLYEADTLAIVKFFNEKRYPVYILDISKEDTSDEFNKKFTYTVKLEGADRTRHTLTFDMPKFMNDCLLYLGGNKKVILNQFFLLPVSKTGPDVVQLCSNYNKIFMRRTGSKASPKIERMKKALAMYKGNSKLASIFTVIGDNRLTNTEYMTNIEYDEMAKSYMNVYINNKDDKYNFYFNQGNIRKYIKTNNLEFKESDTIIPVAIRNNKEVIYLDAEKDLISGTKKSLIDFMGDLISVNNEAFAKDFKSINVGKKYIYTEATIMKRHIPILLLLSYMEGLTTVLKKAKVNHYFTDTKERLSLDDKNNKDYIEFADGYLVYDRYPMKNSLLLNGFTSIPTKNYNYDEFDKKEVYLDIFDLLYNDKKILNAFENFYDLFIDPITLGVLNDLNLPTSFVELMLYGNELLQDNQYVVENHMAHYRMRNNEIPNAILYKQLADAYSNYRGSVGNKNPQKMSIMKDIVLKELSMSQIVKEADELNPALEAENLRVATFKGPSGLNMERAYTLDKRSYNKSMKGIIAMSSPPSGAVGITRQMSMDVNVTSARGYLKIAEDLDELNSANSFCPSELLTTGCAQFDDGARVAMVTSQTKHVVPCKKYDELLITNGADKALAQVVTNNFAYKAKADGKILEIDEDNDIIVVQYKDGTHDIIDIGTRVAKNGGKHKCHVTSLIAGKVESYKLLN